MSAVGFDDIVTKPIEPSRLVQIVSAHLPLAHSEPERFGTGRRLLIADDDPFQLKLTRFRLARLGFEIETVLTTYRTDLLTIGVLLAIYFASNGVEALRTALNRAYEVREMRWWYMCRLESIAYVLIGAVALLIAAFLVVLGPLIWATAVRILPWLAPFGWIVLFIRVAAASVVIVIALTVVYLFLPAGRRRFIDVLPGIVVTLVLWLIGGTLFGTYLASFAQNYVNTYAGLASVMVALVFLYYSAAIFVFGGELNAAIWRANGRIV